MNKGFTLVELLTVIAVIAILSLITTPVVTSIIESADKNSFEITCNEIYSSYSQYEILEDNTGISCNIFDFESNRNNIEIVDTIKYVPISKLNLEGQIPKSGMYRICNDYRKLIIDNGKFTCIKDNNGMKIIDGTIKDNGKDAPIINDIILSSTTNSIKVVVDIIENDGMITNYYYKINGINSSSKGNIKLYENLEKDTEYEIEVTVENKNGLKSNTVSKKIKTKNINIPTYSVTQNPLSSEYATSKNVTILYDTNGQLEYYFKSSVEAIASNKVISGTCGNGIVPGNCQPVDTTNILPNTWYRTNSSIPSIIYQKNGVLYALAKDTRNVSEMSTYTVSKIDQTAPIVNISVGNIKTDRVTVTANCTDSESGITKYEFSNDNGINWIISNKNNYTFTNLKKETNYQYKVKCTNGSELVNEASSNTSTSGFVNPKIKQISKTPISDDYSYASSRTIQISYNNTNVANPEYYFKSSVAIKTTSGVVTATCGNSSIPTNCTSSNITSLNPNVWYKTNTLSPSFVYLNNGVLYALISDGKNISGTSTYTASKIDHIDPKVTVSVNGKTATFTFSDNIGITGYGVSNLPNTAPSFISTTNTKATWTANSAGTYYVWVRDVASRTNTASFTIPQSAFSYAATPITETYYASSVNETYTATSVNETYTASSRLDNKVACNCPHGNQQGPGHCSYDESVGISVTWLSQTVYYCLNNDTLSGTTCTKTTYTCPNGGTLSGTTCIK